MQETIKPGCFCNKLGNRKEYHTGETLGMFLRVLAWIETDLWGVPPGQLSRRALSSLNCTGLPARSAVGLCCVAGKGGRQGQEGCLPTLQLISNTREPAAVFSCLQITLRPSQFGSPCLGVFGHMPAPAHDL